MKKEIYLGEGDIIFCNGNRVKRQALDDKILPVIKELILSVRGPEDLIIRCPRCKREMVFIKKDGYILTYGCNSFGCYEKILISTFPLKL